MDTVTMHMNEHNKILVHGSAPDADFYAFDVINVGKLHFQLIIENSEIIDFVQQMNDALNKILEIDNERREEAMAEDNIAIEQEAQYRRDTM